MSQCDLVEVQTHVQGFFLNGLHPIMPFIPSIGFHGSYQDSTINVSYGLVSRVSSWGRVLPLIGATLFLEIAGLVLHHLTDEKPVECLLALKKREEPISHSLSFDHQIHL